MLQLAVCMCQHYLSRRHLYISLLYLQAHPGLCEALDLDEYHSVCYENNSFQFSPLAPPEERPADGTSQWEDITGPRIEGAFPSIKAGSGHQASCLIYSTRAISRFCTVTPGKGTRGLAATSMRTLIQDWCCNTGRS